MAGYKVQLGHEDKQRGESKVIDSCGGSRKTVSIDIYSILQTEQGC